MLLSNVFWLLASAACFWAVVVIYRALFSPLRSIPGPRIAALNGIWLWIQDVTGHAPQTISKLHSDLGPIVRIGPNEVSINDIDIHNQVLYCQAPKYMKATYFYEPFKTGPSSTFQTAEPREHSTLRRLISKPFSKKSVLEFEPHIWESIDTLSTVLRQNSETNTFFDLSKMSRCLSLDFITKFTYGESTEAVKSPDFHEDILDAFDSFSISNFLVAMRKQPLILSRQFANFFQFMMMPSLRTPSISLLSKLPFKVFQAIPKMRQQVQDALEMYEKSAKFGAVTGFQPLLQSEHTTSLTQNHPLDKDFLIADGISHVFAGTDTTSTTLTLTLIEIFTNPNIYDRLHAELKQAIPNSNETAQLSNLENLPFLTACVKEGLRFSTPVRSRLPRVTPEPGMNYGEYFMPPGTFVSSSPYLMNYNEDVFPNSRAFLPDRWLVNDPAAIKRLDNCWAPFSKGSRGCIGINLATAEVYITLAAIIRRFRLVERRFDTPKIREIFGVVFDEPLLMQLQSVQN